MPATPHTPSLPTPRLGRRAVLGGGVAVLGVAAVTLSGCDAGEAPAPRGALTPTAPAADADSGLVQRVGQAIADTAAVAAAAGAASTRTRKRARGFSALHRTHLDELGWSGDAADPGAVAQARAGAVLDRAEARLQQRLVSAAQQARSGGLAQAFASMAAGVAQRRALR